MKNGLLEARWSRYDDFFNTIYIVGIKLILILCKMSLNIYTLPYAWGTTLCNDLMIPSCSKWHPNTKILLQYTSY